MRDSDSLSPVQRAIVADKAAHQRNQPLVTDGSGNLLNLHKPGWRYLTDANTRMMADAAKQAAYAEVEQRDAQAWKGETGTTNEFIGQRAGDQCTVDAQRRTLVREGNKLVCRVVKRQDGMDEKSAAYAEYDRQMADAWRNSR